MELAKTRQSNRAFLSLPKLPRTIGVLCAVIIALQIVNLAGTAPEPNPADGRGYMAWGQALLGYGHWDPTPVLAGAYYFPVCDINGRRAAMDKYPIGWSLAVLPTAAAGQLLTRATNRLGLTHYPLDGHSPLLTRGAWIGVYLWIDAGIVCAYLAVSKMTTSAIAQWAIPLIWLGTSALAYTWRWPYMSHGLSLAMLSMILLAVLNLRKQACPRFGMTCLLGLLAGLAICVRPLNIVYLVPIGAIFHTGDNIAGLGRSVRIACYGGLGMIGPLFLQAWVWKSVYGAWYFNGYAYSGEHFAVNGHGLMRFLFSSYHGLFFLHPITALCLLGLIIAVPQTTLLAGTRVMAGLLLIAFAVTIVLYGSWSDWDLGEGFGARWVCDPFVFWALGLGFLLSRTRKSKGVLTAAILMGIYSVIIVGGQTANLVSRGGELHVYIPGRGWRMLP
jgi:hypothetical protein